MDKPAAGRRALLVAGLGLLTLVIILGAAWRFCGNVGCRVLVTKVRADSQHILTVARTRHSETGRWPSSIEELTQSQSPGDKWSEVWLEHVPRDPWGGEYRYEIVNGKPRVTCFGKDGVEGGEGEAADIVIPEELAEPASR